MERVALMTKADMHVIRRYVNTKYAPLPGEKRAEIVADAIRRGLRQRLPELPDEAKTKLANELITRCLVRDNRDVSPEDVIDVCSEWNEDKQATELVESIRRWMDERSPGRWSAEQIAGRLSRSGVGGDANAESYVSDANRRSYFKPGKLVWTGLAVTAIGAATAAVLLLIKPDVPEAKPVPYVPQVIVMPAPEPDVGMPPRLRYAEIDEPAVKSYLRGRDALLAEEPYFGAIVASAKAHDVHPLLLFALTGQEQGFVPETAKHARDIANNPFNVFHSWEAYNTDIHDSADIAARTIANLGKKRPEGYEPFSWFNTTYAEDPLWSDGVRRIFEKLSGLVAK
ncbi:hypothetical protein [Cohnella sp. GCM10027633]|uniref:hypothetical protein n=1 Tax=unclassified Cohnella TaxID=2636738 RepID=UPI00363B3A23